MTKLISILVGLFLGLASIASAQTITGAIVGVVTDASGAAIAAADVTLTMTQTGIKKTTKSGDTGEFTFTALEPSVYSVSVVAKGFKKFERTSMNLTAGDRLSTGNMEMQVGAVTDSITVQSEGAMVQTASAEHSGVLTASQVDNLTIKGRNVMSLLQLLPGVVETNSPDGPDRNFGIGLNVNGNRRNATGVSLDGVQTADAGTGWIATANISMDAVAEVKVLLNNFQAEYGRIRGAGVLMVGKSGSRDFHGSFSYFKRHEQFNANNFFSNRSGIGRPRYRYNTYSYNLNGPIMIPKLFNRNREKLFFSWTQEYWPQTSGWGPNTYTVPTELERQGNFAQSIDQSGKAIVVKDPLTGVAFPNMTIPVSRMDVSGASLFKLLPTPNFTNRTISNGSYNYLIQGSFDKPQMMNTLKLDYHITQNDIASFTWSRHSDVQTGTNGLATSNAGWNLEDRTFATRGNIMSGRYQKIFTPTLINELVFGYNWRFENEVIPDSVLKTMTMANIGFTAPQPYPTSNPGLYLPNVTFGGGPTTNPIGLTYTNVGLQANIPTYNITDNITKIRGNHTFKAGFFFNRGNYINQPTNDRGALSFAIDVNNPNDTGNTWANTYMGAFASYSQRNKILVTDGIYKAYEWFVQDSWKVNRRLSLEIGMRFAVSPPGYSAYEEGMFDPRAFDPSKAVKLIQPTMVNGKRVGIDPITQAIYPAVNIGAIAPNSGDLANGIVLASKTQQGIIDGAGLILGPRFGFAWDVFGNGKTAIRGGYGAFQSTGANGEGKAGSQTIVPLTYTARLVYGTLAGLGASASGLLYPSGSTAYRQSGYKYPVSNQISFNVQQSLGWGTVLEVGYVGNMSSHLTWTFDKDALPVGTNFNPKNIDPTTGRAYPTTFLRQYTGFDGVNYLNYGSSSNYHSMQTTVNRRFAKGLQLGGSWTWSKWLGTAEYDGNGMSPFLPARVYNYGLASPDRTHNMRVNFLYEIPKTPWKDFASKWVLNGWSVSGITAFISGSPFNPGVGTTDSHDITGTSSQGPRINLIGVGNLDKSDRTFDRYFNTAAFALPAVGTLGTGGRNYLRGPGTANWDLALYKDFPIKEPFKLQLRGEGYNAFNHTQWAGVNSSTNFNPAGVQTNALFGQVNSARTARILQVALRFVF